MQCARQQPKPFLYSRLCSSFKYSKQFEKVDADIAKFKAGVVSLNTELSKYEKSDNKQNKISELDKALQELDKDILEGENKLKRNKLFAASGENSFALNQINIRTRTQLFLNDAESQTYF